MRLLSFLLLFATATTYGEEQIDYLNLGATLVKDGYYERAMPVLEKVDVSMPNFDFVKYYTVKGILYHTLGYPLVSNTFLNQAIALGQEKKSIYLYIARNHWKREEYRLVIEAIDKGAEETHKAPQTWVIKAEAHKKLGEIKTAWNVLDNAIERFPDYARFYKQKFFYLVELGYFQTAETYAKKYLEKQDYSPEHYLAIGFALRENKQLTQAAALLEEAVIKHPDNDKLLELLGQVYIDDDEYVMAALVFDWASIRFPKFAHKAAALYLKAGEPVRSLQLNRRISKQDDKFRQRLGIDIYLEDYESLTSKSDALKRYDLLKDDNIKYALGFAHYQIREFEQSKHYLKQITDNQLFVKASNLFKQIEKCQNEPLECR